MNFFVFPDYKTILQFLVGEFLPEVVILFPGFPAPGISFLQK